MYDLEYISRYFDDYADREWTRLISEPGAEVKFFIHTYYLQKYIKAGASVLEVGASAGRFTLIVGR